MDRLKGSLAHAIGRCFRRYNRNSLYHSDHIFHSHKGLGQGGLAVFPYHIACLLHAIRRACDGWNGHSDRVLLRITVHITGLLAWRMRSKAALLVVAIAWSSHEFYDFYHDILFINPGVLTWYPAF